MHGAVTPLPQYVFMAWCLVKHRDNFTTYLLFRWLGGPPGPKAGLDVVVKKSIAPARIQTETLDIVCYSATVR